MTCQPKNILRRGISLCLFLLFSLAFSYASFAQREGYLQIFGNIRKDSKNLEGAEIKILKNNVAIQTLYTTSNGKFVFNLPLNGEYIVSVGKPGLLSKSVSVSTAVPDDQKDIIFSYKFNVDMLPAVGDAAS